MPLSDNPIVILGAFRSGTSAMSGALNKMGLFLGEEADFIPANQFNEGGYYELKELQPILQKSFLAFGMLSTQFDTLPEDWKEIPGTSQLVQEIRNLFNAKFTGKPLWGWKDPATSILLPIFQEVLSQEGVAPRYVIMLRNPLDVAASRERGQTKWDSSAPSSGARTSTVPIFERTMGLWLGYTLAALRETKGSVRCLVSYEKMLAEPAATLRMVAEKVLSWNPSVEQITAAVGSIDPKQSHGRDEIAELREWPELVTRSYECFKQIAGDPEGLNSGKYDQEVDSLWAQFQKMRAMMQTLQMPTGQLMLMWRQGGQPGGFAQPYNPNGSWQKTRVSVPAPPGGDVAIDLYQTPCQIWIRDSSWIVDGQRQKAHLQPGGGGMLEDVLGMKRVTVFGPQPILTKAPTSGSQLEFEIEFLVQSSQVFATNIVSVLRSRMEQMRRAAPSPYMARR